MRKMRKAERKSSSKAAYAAAILAAAALLAAGCGKDEKVIDGSVQDIQPQEVGEAAGAEASQPGQAGEPEGTSEGEKMTTENDTGVTTSGGEGYAFTYNGTLIEIDADAAPILEKLGEPASYFEAASCAFDGLDKTYTFNSFELDTYPNGDKDYVYGIVLKDDSITTAEGICIGDSREKVLEAYPEGAKEECNMVIYEKGGMKLVFILAGEEVASIEYRSTVLE